MRTSLALSQISGLTQIRICGYFKKQYNVMLTGYQQHALRQKKAALTLLHQMDRILHTILNDLRHFLFNLGVQPIVEF